MSTIVDRVRIIIADKAVGVTGGFTVGLVEMVAGGIVGRLFILLKEQVKGFVSGLLYSFIESNICINPVFLLEESCCIFLSRKRDAKDYLLTKIGDSIFQFCTLTLFFP